MEIIVAEIIDHHNDGEDDGKDKDNLEADTPPAPG
jgi:hypothetical protein